MTASIARIKQVRILYFSQFYKPENIAAAFRATEHSSLWTTSGHDVTVFTGWPNYPVGKLFDGYNMVPLREERIDGVRVFRSASKIQPNTSFGKRIESGVSYIWRGLKNLGPKSPIGIDYDVVLVTCGTVFAAWLGVQYARKHKLPLVIEFRDLTYKQMIATGAPELSAKVRIMKALEMSFCKAADEVVVLTEGFKADLISEGIPEARISVIPNGANLVPCKHDWSGSLRLGYFGTMGLSQNVPSTLRLAKGLADRGLASKYLLIGEGASRSEVEEDLASGSGSFIELKHGMSKDELERYYADVDMTVVSLQKSESFKGTIPSKIFQSLARGVPVLFYGPEGDAAELVRRSRAGLALCGTEEDDFAALVEFASNPELASELALMSGSAVDFMERNYTRKRMAEQMLEVLERVASK